MAASLNGHVEVVLALLDAGVDLNQVNNVGDNALVYACHDDQGHVEVVQLLLARGANGINRAHTIAAGQGNIAIVEILAPLL